MHEIQVNSPKFSEFLTFWVNLVKMAQKSPRAENVCVAQAFYLVIEAILGKKLGIL